MKRYFSYSHPIARSGLCSGQEDGGCEEWGALDHSVKEISRGGEKYWEVGSFSGLLVAECGTTWKYGWG
jgi:hypothetical protein